MSKVETRLRRLLSSLTHLLTQPPTPSVKSPTETMATATPFLIDRISSHTSLAAPSSGQQDDSSVYYSIASTTDLQDELEFEASRGDDEGAEVTSVEETGFHGYEHFHAQLKELEGREKGKNAICKFGRRDAGVEFLTNKSKAGDKGDKRGRFRFLGALRQRRRIKTRSVIECWNSEMGIPGRRESTGRNMGDEPMRHISTSPPRYPTEEFSYPLNVPVPTYYYTKRRFGYPIIPPRSSSLGQTRAYRLFPGAPLSFWLQKGNEEDEGMSKREWRRSLRARLHDIEEVMEEMKEESS